MQYRDVKEKDITIIKPLGGTTKTKRFVVLFEGKKYALKYGDRNAHNEYNFYKLFEANGLIVPDVFLANINGDVAVFIEYIDQVVTINDIAVLREKQMIDLFKIFCIDKMFGNWDRHGNNILVDENNNIIPIDNEDFGYSVQNPIRLKSYYIKQLKKYFQLNPPDFLFISTDDVKINPTEIDNVKKYILSELTNSN